MDKEQCKLQTVINHQRLVSALQPKWVVFYGEITELIMKNDGALRKNRFTTEGNYNSCC